MWDNKTYRILAIVIAAILLAGIIAICIAVPLSCGAANKVVYENKYKTTTKVGIETEYLGTVKRKIPTETKNEGMSSVGYPKYGYTLGDCVGSDEEKVALRNAIIAESWSLCSINTRVGSDGYPKNTYNQIMADGSLYLNGEPARDANGNVRTLYKHTGAEGMYLGEISADEPGIVKKITFSPRDYLRGYGVTGVYAPAGEVVKIEISDKDMKATGGIVVHVGQALYNNKANNIWLAKNQMQRMPVILNTLVINEQTATLKYGVWTGYIGSFLGGPVYVCNEKVKFSVTVSGAVRYSHFILGHTTLEEFKDNARSSTPFFDLEVWENGVLHSGPKAGVPGLTTGDKPKTDEELEKIYDNLYNAAVLWDKIALVSTKVSTQGIVFLYDPFVAAGAAVAFPGQGAVNCPAGWMSGSLNYDAFIKGGAWGNMHEYNHNFQGWGIGAGGEVTNNAMTLVEYSLFTRISAARRVDSATDGMGGWNRYTSAPFALRQITESRFENGQSGLALYATILHNFGQEAFINMVKSSGGQSPDTWLRATTSVSHNNFTYFIKDMLGHAVSDTALTAEQKAYPMFVPVASAYQTGRSYNYDGAKRYITTMQPYAIKYGEDFTVDLRKYTETAYKSGMYKEGSIVLPEGFSYEIKNVTQPEHGSIKKTDEGIYVYTPDKENLNSGKIIVTLGITKDDRTFNVDDVDLVLEFEQSHEMNKNVLERTVYKFADKKYETASSAFAAGYAGNSGVVTTDNVNTVQNSNADVWLTAEEGDAIGDNSMVEIKGKMQVGEAGKYRMALRGRWNCALYYSVNKDADYIFAGEINDTTNTSNSGGSGVNFMNGSLFNTKCPYVDLELKAGDEVYFKEVMAYKNNNGTRGYIGLGWGKEEHMGGAIDENGNQLGEEKVTLSVGYASAVRSSYRNVVGNFNPPYFYTRQYKCDYTDERYYSTFDKPDAEKGENYEVKLISDNPGNWGDGSIDKLFNGNTADYWHSSTGVNGKPIELKIDMGRPITVNTMTAFSRGSQAGAPKNFVLSVSSDNVEYTRLGEYTDAAPAGSTSTTVKFETATFRYFSLYVTDSTYSVTGNHFLILSQIRFANSRSLPGAAMISPENDAVTLRGKWEHEYVTSNFGKNYVGKKGANVLYEFEGTRFGILSSARLDANFEVKIDGKKLESIALTDDQGDIRFTYISPELENGKHKVEVRCKSESAIDSLAYWQAQA